MKKVLIIERSSFAQLIRDYKRSLNIILAFEHIMREKDIDLTMMVDEVAAKIGLKEREIQRNIEQGRLRFDEIDGQRYFNLMDLINLKDHIDSKYFYHITMSQSYPDHAVTLHPKYRRPEYTKPDRYSQSLTINNSGTIENLNVEFK